MHTLATQLLPVLAAEKSKTAYFIAGGLLVAWALIVSVGLGLRKPDFPGSLTGQRVVIAITVVLVVATASTAVITSGGPEAATAETGSSAQTTTSGAANTSTPATSPKATTGTPAPPSSPAATQSTTLRLAANPAGQLAYEPKALAANAGTVTIHMTNMSPIEHDVAVSEGKKVLGQTPIFTGGTKTLTLNLKPGTYTFYCTVPGHRQAGMEGTLTVT